MENFPFLTLITFIPMVGALIILALPDEGRMEDEQRIQNVRSAARNIAAVTTLISLVLSAIVYAYIYSISQGGVYDPAVGERLFFVEDGPIAWVPAIGITYHMGVDGISAPMIFLTGLASFCGVLISWKIDKRPREFFAWFLLLVAGVYGVFVALDMFLLFFFYELAIFPMYILIATWGWKALREYAAMKLTLFILIGSVISIIGVIAMYLLMLDSGMTSEVVANMGLDGSAAGVSAVTFNIRDFMAARDMGLFDQTLISSLPGLGEVNISFAQVWFPFIFLGFAVLAGIFPFHNWSPDGHVAAPTAVSMIHAGVLMKLGAYAALRVAVFLLPEGAFTHLPWIVLLALVNVVYGSFIALVQRDFKYVIGFSSVSHMGLVSLGFATMNVTGMTGAGLQMFSHGAMTALFFASVGMVYDQAHTRDIPSLGGFWQKMPTVAIAFVIAGFVSMGMPGLSGFVAEFPIFKGLFEASRDLVLINGVEANYYALIAIIAVFGIPITAFYVLRVSYRVFFGEFEPERYHDPITDVTWRDKLVLAVLSANLIILGAFPFVMSDMVEAAMRPVAALLGG